MKKALVFIETKDGKAKRSSLEGLSVFHGKDFEVNTVAIGEGADTVAGELGAWGVTTHFACTDDAAKVYNPEAYQNLIAQAIEKSQPNIIVASSNNLGRDVFPRLAAQFEAAYMSDLTDMSVDGELTLSRPMYAGKCSAQVTFTDDSMKILLMRPNQVTVVTPSASTATTTENLSLSGTSGNSQTVSIEKGQSEKLDLTEADTIVSGGRGLKDAENFQLLERLAEPLGATVGASRAVVDLGWVPHSLQVGQTGKTVAPTLYFAVGISGAIQHLAGMSGSKNIVAINKDDKAPIFQKANYGIVGDLFEVVPLLTEKLQSLK